MSKQLILASSSPRRQELLTQVNIPYTVRKVDTDESQITTNDPVEKVTQLAALKGNETPILHEDDVILSADTVISYQHDIFGKPENKQDAKIGRASCRERVKKQNEGEQLKKKT